jgi:hypothetical protein
MKRLQIAILAVAATALVISVWGLSWYWLTQHSGMGTWQERSEFGQAFGAINALFAGLAYAGLIITIFLQTRQLSIQSRQLEHAHDELVEQRRRIESQTRMLARQQFEGTFFQLLTFHHDTVDSLNVQEGDDGYRGSRCFEKIYSDLSVALASVSDSAESESPPPGVDEYFDTVYRHYQHSIAHYFHNLYCVIHFVDQSDAVTNKDFYVDFVRSQLSTHELLVLFYYSLSHYGRNRFKPLIVSQQILRYLPEDQLLLPTHRSMYSSSGFRQA